MSRFQTKNLGSDMAWKMQAVECLYKNHMSSMHLLAWQANYDLKDPKGLAGFLIDSDIKLVRAEWGSLDESSRDKSQGDMKRNRMHKMKTRQVSNYSIGFFSWCVVSFFSIGFFSFRVLFHFLV